jgi:hypothetical protein
VNVTQQYKVINEGDKAIDGICGTIGEVNQKETRNYLFRDRHFPAFVRKIYEETQKESEPTCISILNAGEFEINGMISRKSIVELLNSAIDLIDEVLDVYDEDEIERLNTFTLCKEKIISLWELREAANSNFVDVLVLLEVAVKNSHYQNYRKKQYKSIKMVLEKIKDVNITHQEVKECRKILMDNGIDLFAPIRNWEDYKIEIKKKNASD